MGGKVIRGRREKNLIHQINNIQRYIQEMPPMNVCTSPNTRITYGRLVQASLPLPALNFINYK